MINIEIEQLELERLKIASLALNNYNFGAEIEKKTFWQESCNIWSTIIYLKYLDLNPDYKNTTIQFIIEFFPNSSIFLDCYAIYEKQKFGMLNFKNIKSNVINF